MVTESGALPTVLPRRHRIVHKIQIFKEGHHAHIAEETEVARRGISKGTTNSYVGTRTVNHLFMRKSRF